MLQWREKERNQPKQRKNEAACGGWWSKRILGAIELPLYNRWMVCHHSVKEAWQAPMEINGC
jgi:hypothetical protein